MKRIFNGKHFDLLYDDVVRDSVIEHVMRSKDHFFDPFLKDIYDQYVKPYHNLVEVGAHVGTHTCYLSKLANTVIAYEPQPALYAHLMANLWLNGCENVAVFNLACYSKTCRMKARLFADQVYDTITEKAGISFGECPPEGGGLIVSACRLDDMATIHRVHFLKIDAEGNDLQVALGAMRIIKDNRPTIVFEDNAAQIGRWRGLLEPLGYRIDPLDHPNYIAILQP